MRNRTALVLLLSGIVGVMITACLWLTLPLIAPQFVIRYSPWWEPSFRAEVYETQGYSYYPYLYKKLDHNRVSCSEQVSDGGQNKEYVDFLLSRVTSTHDSSTRRTAISILSGFYCMDEPPPKAVVSTLIQALKDDDKVVFGLAFNLLCLVKEPAAAEALLPMIPRICRENPGMVDQVSWTDSIFIGSEGKEDELSALTFIPVCKQVREWLLDADPRMHSIAILTLSYSTEPECVTILSEQCEKPLPRIWGLNNPLTVAFCRNALPATKDLIRNLCADPNPARKIIGLRAASGRDEFHDVYIRLCHENQPAIQEELAQVMGWVTPSHMEPILDGLLERGGKPARILISSWSVFSRRPWEKSGNASVSSVYSVSEDPEIAERRIQKNSEQYELLKKYCHHLDTELRREIARKLCASWQEDTVAVLTSLANDRDQEIRTLIAKELERIAQKKPRTDVP